MGWGQEGRRHVPALPGGGRERKTFARDLRLRPFPRRLPPGGRQSPGSAGQGRGRRWVSCASGRREKSNPCVPGDRARSSAQRTIPGSRPSPVLPVSTPRRPRRLRAHIRSAARSSHAPGCCLPGEGSASPVGPRGSSAASLRLRPRPYLLPALPRPRSSRPPRSWRLRGAGAGEALACR